MPPEPHVGAPVHPTASSPAMDLSVPKHKHKIAEEAWSGSGALQHRMARPCCAPLPCLGWRKADRYALSFGWREKRLYCLALLNLSFLLLEVIPGACSLAPTQRGRIRLRSGVERVRGLPTVPIQSCDFILPKERPFFPCSVSQQQMSLFWYAGPKAMTGPACHEG